MPMRKLQIQPGVNLERTPTLNQTQLASCNLIRFYSGLPQKLGGWQQLSAQTFVGTASGLHGWADILGNPYLAVGTEQRLEVMIGGELFDITPIVATENPAVAFTTTIGSAAVEIADSVYNPNAGDWINLVTAVSVGGVVLQGLYLVVSVPDGTHYTITSATPATANVSAAGAVPNYTTTNGSAAVTVTLANHGLIAGSLFTVGVSTTVATVVLSGIYSVTSYTDANNFVITASSLANASTSAFENGGNAQIAYLLPSGYALATATTGYGIGDYGAGDYGKGGTGQIISPLRQWSMDHWGQDLVASPTGGGIYYWPPPDKAPAIVMPNAPLYSNAVFVMPQVQIIVALGAAISGTQEPLLARWCDAGDFTDWTATATNQAGSYQVATGNKLLAGLAVGLGALLWTDIDLTAMTYQGLPFVFSFNRIATGCGIVAMRAAGISGSFVMWMSLRGFFTYSMGGGVTPIECPVWDFIINNIDAGQLDKVHCAVNSLFNEMAWHFPISTTSPLYAASAPMTYVKYNYVEHVWDYGQSSQYQRTAWVGRSPVGNSVGADYDGLLQQHEIGYDANGAAMIGGWQTGFFDLSEGEDFVFVDMLIPDFVTLGGATLMLSVYPTAYPNQATNQIGPFPVTAETDFVPLRARGRQIALGASWSDLGSFNRLGALRYRYAPDGRI